MAEMMAAYTMADTKNTIALPLMMESSALFRAPEDFIRSLETPGICAILMLLFYRIERKGHEQDDNNMDFA